MIRPVHFSVVGVLLVAAAVSAQNGATARSRN